MAFWPELPPSVLLAFRTLYGLLLLATLAQALPQWRRFFFSEKWGGYTQSSPLVDALQNPFVSSLLGLIWTAAAVALAAGWHIVPAAAVNLLLCRYFFLQLRWRGVLRGFGAPGYMAYWFGLAIFLLEYTARHAPALSSLALLVLQTDFALIIASAAFYKLRSGYPRGEGMDYGLVNPMWGYWPDACRRLPPGHWILRGLNQLAWSSQLLSAALMLIPATRFWGGVIVLVTYVFIVTQIRLGFLAEMMWLGGALFCVTGSPGATLLAGFLSAAPPVVLAATHGIAALNTVLTVFLWLYLVALPLCHAGLFVNFYSRRRLPAGLQHALEVATNFFGIILWRVFSVDHLNFFVNIYHAVPGGATRTLLSEWRNPRNLRFWHVGEAIVVTSLFTTLKYYPDDDTIFTDRVGRYARTLSCPAGHELVFEYVSIQKIPGNFIDRVICRYHVDPTRGSLRCVVLDPGFSPKAAHHASPVHEAAHPGSYAPKAT